MQVGTVGGRSGERQIPAPPPAPARAPSRSPSEGGVWNRAAGEEDAGGHRQIHGPTRRHCCVAAAHQIVAGPRREAVVACRSVASMCATKVTWAGLDAGANGPTSQEKASFERHVVFCIVFFWEGRVVDTQTHAHTTRIARERVHDT